MDSLTQLALGAAVSTALLGSRVGPRRAVLIGSVLGTLPDLDILIPYSDPIDTFVLHRGATHALFVHALVTPLFGEAILRLYKELRPFRKLTYLAVFLCFATHAMIDAMTVYGTRLFWPLSPDPVGVGSIFIIDPIYTIPLLVAVIWALCVSDWTDRLRRVTTIALTFSTLYMAGTVGLQKIMESRARTLLVEAGYEVDQVFAIAAPFNTIFWKVVALEKDRYHNIYISFLDGDGPAEIYTHQRRADLLSCLSETPAMEKLNWFTHGFLRAEEQDDRVVVADLRMGLTPNYVFQFAIAEQKQGHNVPIPPERHRTGRAAQVGDVDWLLTRITGNPAERKAESRIMVAETREKAMSAC